MRQTFHVFRYLEGIVGFEDMPRYFDGLNELIVSLEVAGRNRMEE